MCLACALQFIMDYVATEDNVNLPRDQVFVMRIQKHFFWLMAQLFDHYINYGHVYKVAHHRVFRDPKFLNFFIDYVKKREMKDEMILQVDGTVKVRQYIVFVELIFALFPFIPYILYCYYWFKIYCKDLCNKHQNLHLFIYQPMYILNILWQFPNNLLAISIISESTVIWYITKHFCQSHNE